MEYNNNTMQAPEKTVPRKKKISTFVLILFILLGILTTLVMMAAILGMRDSVHIELIKPGTDGFSFGNEDTVPSEIVPGNMPGTVKEKEQFVPSEMPELDGVAPELKGYEDSIFFNNPIPEIYDAVSESVVAVLNYRSQKINAHELLTIYGSGTGFIVSENGYVLTNAHVVEKAEKVKVRLVNGDEYDAVVMGADTETDVAILKIEAAGLKAIAIGDSDDIHVGEFVIAIGNPIDEERLANTTTLGIVSATARELTIDSYTNTYIQTDAAINFGNSGGPLLNMKGEVIGMNSAKSVTAGYDDLGNSLSAEGLGFALPINSVIEIMEHLLTVGDIQRPAVGITVANMTELLAAQLDIPFSEGVLVYTVVKNGPADDAGVLTGDIIVEANGTMIKDKEQLIDIINACEIGDSIELKILRNGEYITCSISLSLKEDMDFDDIVQ